VHVVLSSLFSFSLEVFSPLQLLLLKALLYFSCYKEDRVDDDDDWTAVSVATAVLVGRCRLRGLAGFAGGGGFSFEVVGSELTV
jgi:hypothetical protein